MPLADRIVDLSTRPIPLRTLFFRRLFQRWPLGAYLTRLRGGAVNRPHYGWCMYHAAEMAKALGHKAVTILELGVAGGNGLVCLCEHREEIQKLLGIEIVVVGFDTGAGLPPSRDVRDLLYCWPTGSFKMDRGALEKRIAGRAQLVIGDVAKTVASWIPRPEAPIGAIMFDLDFYSSTVDALPLLTKANVLPRVWCYFDDIYGYSENCYTERIGVREAIREFGVAVERDILSDHLSPAFTFKGLQPEAWHEHIYLYHRFSHPDYNICLSRDERHELRLTA